MEVSARGTLEKQQLHSRVAELERENARLRNTVVGLGALVADAQQQGFIAAVRPTAQETQGTLEQRLEAQRGAVTP